MRSQGRKHLASRTRKRVLTRAAWLSKARYLDCVLACGKEDGSNPTHSESGILSAFGLRAEEERLAYSICKQRADKRRLSQILEDTLLGRMVEKPADITVSSNPSERLSQSEQGHYRVSVVENKARQINRLSLSFNARKDRGIGQR